MGVKKSNLLLRVATTLEILSRGRGTKKVKNRCLMMTRKCYSVRRSPIDENNDSVSKSWIVFHHRIVAKLTSAVEFSAAEILP